MLNRTTAAVLLFALSASSPSWCQEKLVYPSLPSVERDPGAEELDKREIAANHASLDYVLLRLSKLVGKRVKVEGISWGTNLPYKVSGQQPYVITERGKISLAFKNDRIRSKWKDGKLIRAVGVVRRRAVDSDTSQISVPAIYHVEVETLEFVEEVELPNLSVLDK